MSRVATKPCPTCGKQNRYSHKWDAHYCRFCNVWLKKPCGCTADSPPMECMYSCWERPERPLKRAARKEQK